MIDFRYHLVSLVAVFLALAIGIVMGAGPLRASLGEQLTEQVSQLRADRDAMRVESERVTAENRELSGYIEATGPDLVEHTLDGKSVVIVTDHESMGPTAESTQQLIRAAGGAVTNIVTLNPVLWDPGKESVRQDAVAHLVKNWPAVIPAHGNSSAKLSAVVARITSRTSELTDAERTEIASYLRNAGFIQTARPHLSAADGMTYLGAEQDSFAEKDDDASKAGARSNNRLESLTALVTEAQSLMRATVVAGHNSAPATSEGIVRTVRGSGGTIKVATVDGVKRASGPAVATLTLAGAYIGDQGNYGVASDASDVAPSPSHIRTALSNDKANNTSASDGGGS